jgi:putative addiction module killer protein
MTQKQQRGNSKMPGQIDKPQNVSYEGQVVRILKTDAFGDWLNGLRDRKARLRIDDRIRRVSDGNFGDTKSVGDGVQELRLPFGPGYRIYYIWHGLVLIILLHGGDKSSQAGDIAKAKGLAKEIRDGGEIDSL